MLPLQGTQVWYLMGKFHTLRDEARKTNKQVKTLFRKRFGLLWWLGGKTNNNKKVHLPMQGTQFWPLVWEAPICLTAAKSKCCSYWDCALESSSHSSGVRVPQLLKPKRLRARVLPQGKLPPWEAHAPQVENSPHTNKDPAQSKVNK